MIPVFPTLTFPNHYSIVTGMYPPYHGIINNYFVDPVDGDAFTMSSHEPKWWLGEPMWETVVNHGLQAATFFWPGSEVKKGAWDCSPEYCQKYNESVPFDQRVDTILSYFDLPVDSDKLPSFLTLYFEDPDEEGHEVGPDDVAITAAVANIDRLIGRIIEGLEERNVFQDVHVILVGDHGMVGTCDKKIITLSDLTPWIKIPSSWVQYTTPVLSIRPNTSFSNNADVVSKMNKALESGKVENGAHLKMYLKEDLPKRLHYADSDRIPPIIGILDEGYTVEEVKSTGRKCGGAHGYDNKFFSMRSVFAAHGPRFQRGMKVPSFENVEIYNLVADILGIEGAPNNGSSQFAKRVLLPKS